MSEILTIGEPLVVLASNELDVPLEKVAHFDRYMGGAELNVATGISRLGHSVSYVAQVGSDPFGKFIHSEIGKRNIDFEYVTTDSKYWTGHQIKDLVSKGDPVVFNFRSDSASAHFDETKIDQIDLSEVKYVHMTGIFPSLSAKSETAFEKLLEKVSAANVPICFDTNLRPDLWSNKKTMIRKINYYASRADIVLPGVGEGETLCGSKDPEMITDFYLESPKTRLVIVKVGAKGAYYKSKDGENGFVPGFKVKEVKDTVGAGDGFAVGVLTSLLEKMPLKDVVQRGNAIGALQVQAFGDNNGYPTSKELREFLKNNM
ncbi:MAG TPA: sugar kinase [Ligilactobacillus acidipiscis]|uniref:Sugar kinase n=1 Tax=Ligilactobacillus acidipiscis TaxID=89059 RepID=A0A921K1B6_9LACO|nr:sugar kinase [Ligilactobacillus acidipiscis]